MARVGHTKSRTGCLRCKKRRVKCDEKIPCNACVRHNMRCSLLEQSQQSGAVTPGLSDPSGRSASSTPLPTAPTDTSVRSNFSYSASWLLDIHLAHHYSAVACGSLPCSPEVIAILKVELMQEALLHPYLLHELLAFSGFHLAFINPDESEKYLLHASHHQSIAIKGMRDALSTAITSTNCHALFATSLFLIIGAFAASPTCASLSKSSSPIQNVLHIFSLVNGTDIILQSSTEALRSGPLKGIFIQPLRSHAHHFLQPLFEQLLKFNEYLRSAEDIDENARKVFQTCGDALSKCIGIITINQTMGAPREFRAIFVWPMYLPKGFLDLARDGHPASLVILSYYSVLLHWAEPACWFLKSWARWLIGDIIQESAGSPWATWIGWSVNCIHST